MSSINIDVSLMTIIVVLVGPAFVFLRVSKLATAAMIYRLHKIDVSYSATSEMPHKDYVTYVLFPLALAGVLWLGDLINFTPLESYSANYLELIFEPGWLIKYSLFAWVIAMLGMMSGAITGLGFASVARTVGLALPDDAERDTDPPLTPERQRDDHTK